MREVLIFLVILLTCVLANVCNNNGAGRSIFVCRNGNLEDLKRIPRYTRSIKFMDSDLRNIPANSFARFAQLKSLSLVNCSIDNVAGFAFKGLSQLKTLNLSRNGITRIRENVFSGLKNLQYLDLTNNKIETIADENFSNVSNVGLFDLRYNNLTRIDIAILRPLSGASTLDVRFNNLRCVSHEGFNHTRLKWFYIGDNPWEKQCWARLTQCLYNNGIYYGKNQAFDTLTEDRLVWNVSYHGGRELPSKEEAEEKTNILKEAEGWKKYYETIVQEIADERQRLEDLAIATEESKPSVETFNQEDEDNSEIGLVHYGRAFILWILTACRILPAS